MLGMLETLASVLVFFKVSGGTTGIYRGRVFCTSTDFCVNCTETPGDDFLERVEVRIALVGTTNVTESVTESV